MLTLQILEVPAIVLANLCVAYIMTNQNELAEEVMRRIEREEERVNAEDPSRQTLHLCIVNLVIGTLYCAKGNYEFGISRVIKSIDPVKKKVRSWCEHLTLAAKYGHLVLCETMLCGAI